MEQCKTSHVIRLLNLGNKNGHRIGQSLDAGLGRLYVQAAQSGLDTRYPELFAGCIHGFSETIGYQE